MSRTNEERQAISAGMSVSERRDKAAELGVSMSDFKAGIWRPSQGATPKPSSSSSSSSPKPPSPPTSSSSNYGPSPKPSSSSSSGGSSGGGGGSSSYSNAKNKANSYSNMKVAERREDAKSKGMSMSEWKSTYLNGGGGSSSGGGGNIGSSSTKGSGQSSNLPLSTGNSLIDKYGSGLQGYANWWNSEGKQARIDSEAEYRKNNPLSGMVTGWDKWSDINVGSNGLFDWDSTAPINALDVKKMKEFGIKGGDQIFDPSKYNSINPESTTDGRLDAHQYAAGIAMPLRTNSQSYLDEHNAQMQRNEWLANADGTQMGDASHLYQDAYAVGYHGADDSGMKYVGSQHHESVKKAILDHQKFSGTKDIKSGIDSYIRDGGYAGDALKFLDEGHKQNLTSEADIKWYNSLIKSAENFDWEKENWSRAGDAGGYYDVRAGGLAKQYEPGGSGTWEGMAAAGDPAAQARLDAMGLQGLQETADIEGGNAGSSLEANQPFGYQHTPSQYQRKYDLGPQAFMTNWMDTRFS